MHEARNFIYGLFIVAAVFAITSKEPIADWKTYLIAFGLLWLFSSLYDHFKLIVTSKKGESAYIDYGINYSLAIALFSGPIGLLIYETILRFTEFVNKKRTNTAEPDEIRHTIYNIGSFTFNGTLGYYIFYWLHPYFQTIPFGFWILLFLIIGVMSLLSDIFIIIVFKLLGEMNTMKEAVDFIKTRSILDMGKISFTNGLLLLFLQEQQWEIIISLLILNYLVSRSFLDKSQSMQNKIERDKFEMMAYSDFLTNLHNRAYMDLKMNELDHSNEPLGIVVADIDMFKKINDTYNHAIGDHVIKQFASTLKDFLNKDDYVFRSGGEEFTLFLRKRNFKETVDFVKKVKHHTETSSVSAEYNEQTVSISFTASFGLYYFVANEHVSMEKGYIQADQLLLQSKRHGRNRISVRNGTIN